MIDWSTPYLDASHSTFGLVDARVAKREGSYRVSVNGSDLGATFKTLEVAQSRAEVWVVDLAKVTLAALSDQQKAEAIR